MTDPTQDPQPAASVFARAGLLVYAMLIIYGSWYPFTGWHDMGLKPWAFLFAPLPHYWTWFDAITNVIAYMPLGLLAVFALYPSMRGAAAAAAAFTAGTLLSGLMEAGQTFLPSRVSSNLDLITNAGGTLLGAIAGLLLCRIFLEESRLLQLRKDWFTHEAGRGLMVIGLWPLAQIYPQGYLFGHGQFLHLLSAWLSKWRATPVDLSAMLRHGGELTVQEYWLAETIITACGMTGACLAMLCLLRKQAPKSILVFALVVTTLLVKALATALLFTPDSALVWLTPGAKGGLVIGTMMVYGLASARPLAQRRLAVVTLLATAFVVNFVPVNPYFEVTLQAWLQGKFLNFNGAAHMLAMVWPLFALWFLLHPVHRANRAKKN